MKWLEWAMPQTPGDNNVILPESEWLRLRRLENAVVNYGGGSAALAARAKRLAKQHQQAHPELAVMLTDIVQYLEDVVAVGQLEQSVDNIPVDGQRLYGN